MFQEISEEGVANRRTNETSSCLDSNSRSVKVSFLLSLNRKIMEYFGGNTKRSTFFHH